MTPDARTIALAAMEASGRTVPQMWAELRAFSGHKPGRRVQRPTWSDVHEWVTHLVIDQMTEQLKPAPQWVIVFVRERAARREASHA